MRQHLWYLSEDLAAQNVTIQYSSIQLFMIFQGSSGVHLMAFSKICVNISPSHLSSNDTIAAWHLFVAVTSEYIAQIYQINWKQ